MYKTPDYDYEQLSFTSFNATCGMQLDPENEWVHISKKLPWRAWESLYSILFPSDTGNVAKPCRMVIGSLILQMRMGFTDRELVSQIQQNPYYQYFVGIKAFQHVAPYSRTLLVEWRKRLDIDLVIKINDMLGDATPKSFRFRRGKSQFKNGTLLATQICDATVAPQNIRFPQDVSLLNEARLKLEAMIDFFHNEYAIPMPRTYRKKAHSEYLSFAKSKRPGFEKTRTAVKGQLGYVRRDIEYIDRFMQDGYAPARRFIDNIITIHVLYEQQLYMYQNHIHKVDDRIVSISQPYVRPIVRGKVKSPTEFGAKLHLSIDETGFARIEHISFDGYNEGPQLIDALKAYKYRNGFYPERVLVDQIYRTRSNIAFCNENGIRISGPKLGRPALDADKTRKDRRTASKDNSDRIEVERYFSTAKRRNGMGKINRKRKDTSLSTIAMSVLVTNIFSTFKSAVDEYEAEIASLPSRQKKQGRKPGISP